MANFPRPNSEEGKIANAIECIEYSDELDQHDVKRLMTAAIRKCEDPSVCRDFINALCKREDVLQDERLIKVTQELEKALENYFAAGCSLGIDFECNNMENLCDTIDLDSDSEYFHIHATFDNMGELGACIELPYA